MKKIIATALVGAGAVLPLAGCGDGNDDNTDTTMQTSMEMPATTETESEESTPTSVTSTDQLGTFDQAKLDAFVVAFRSGYSDLSEDRDDDSIENIVIASCNDLANGVSEEQVTEKIRVLAANKGTEPSQDQAERIYDIVTPACP
ncbi:hypothetical protein GS894_11355 [Rhodococcus hoagii]|uniref:DUF732 domain-containing protein n=3 Tax=Rhodococcus hoagii TaxID=43767 RepID=E9SZV4_RHOHA|nr:hypothetical protein [Prescottella equi]MBU4613891.1 hypothetical protein [Rhodococcus sp. GG48]MCD7053527.1 hypothetical protein [Rhodococcus sp. BH2-1]GBF13679.1 hypothetical protein Br6_01038 [Rhodococcus sp. Br-6]AVP68891.1 hypothetical protein C7H75_13655 [Prescottella equi]EGD24537.1 hypothetical protein HMPREF0724_11655 [Prescottella equi ATCC 33707]